MCGVRKEKGGIVALAKRKGEGKPSERKRRRSRSRETMSEPSPRYTNSTPEKKGKEGRLRLPTPACERETINGCFGKRERKPG